jgi:hypothetical protein
MVRGFNGLPRGGVNIIKLCNPFKYSINHFQKINIPLNIPPKDKSNPLNKTTTKYYLKTKSKLALLL